MKTGIWHCVGNLSDDLDQHSPCEHRSISPKISKIKRKPRVSSKCHGDVGFLPGRQGARKEGEPVQPSTFASSMERLNVLEPQ